MTLVKCVWLGSLTLVSGFASSEVEVKELEAILRFRELYRDVVVLTRPDSDERYEDMFINRGRAQRNSVTGNDLLNHS